MFFSVFQEKSVITLGILKGFLTEKTLFHGKQWFSRKDKIALQGAGIGPRGALE